MPSPALTVEVLPAGYGDAILLTCATKPRPWRLLVDTGPDECWPMLKARLAQIPPDAAGHRGIDLTVISHIDHDHIGGAHALFSDRDLGLTFGDIWFNAPPRPARRGAVEGQSLAKLLGAVPAQLPWNKAWHGLNAVTAANTPFVELPSDPAEPRLTLLSPTPDALLALFKVWDATLMRLGEREEPVAPARATRGGEDLETLANKVTAVDRAPANGSSITLLLEFRGRSVLLGADAHSTVLVPALKALAAHRGISLPWEFDIFKLSHHGSRANVTQDLMRAVQAQHYVVSTNGAIFGHPNDEAIARVILAGGQQRSIWFNYRTGRTERWASEDLQARYRYAAKYPEPGEATVISLAPVALHQ